MSLGDRSVACQKECDICGKTFINDVDYDTHVFTIHGQMSKKFAC